MIGVAGLLRSEIGSAVAHVLPKQTGYRGLVARHDEGIPHAIKIRGVDNPAKARAARAMLKLGVRKVAELAKIAPNTVSRVEQEEFGSRAARNP